MRMTVREITQPLAALMFCEATQQLVAVSARAVLTMFALQVVARVKGGRVIIQRGYLGIYARGNIGCILCVCVQLYVC